jgi:hypothetical protein
MSVVQKSDDKEREYTSSLEYSRRAIKYIIKTGAGYVSFETGLKAKEFPSVAAWVKLLHLTIGSIAWGEAVWPIFVASQIRLQACRPAKIKLFPGLRKLLCFCSYSKPKGVVPVFI